jgi:broad specificity polyphosphatase/5'/3'-nucleotidase SurE
MTAADWEGIAAIVTAVLTGVPAIIIALRSSSAAKQANAAIAAHLTPEIERDPVNRVWRQKNPHPGASS